MEKPGAPVRRDLDQQEVAKEVDAGGKGGALGAELEREDLGGVDLCILVSIFCHKRRKAFHLCDVEMVRKFGRKSSRCSEKRGREEQRRRRRGGRTQTVPIQPHVKHASNTNTKNPHKLI